MTTTRTAVINSAKRGDSIDTIRRYLPSNYTADLVGETILITGQDSHGWTMDGYVLPRLASGCIYAREVVVDWEPDAYGSGILFAGLNGINATIAPPDEDEKWFWLVQPTGKRSEFPEVSDCGTEDSPEAAKSKATAALIKADSLYQTAGPEGW